MKRIFVITVVVIAACISSRCISYWYEINYRNGEIKAKYYEGYICTMENQPIPDLRILPVRADDPTGITNKSGYFKFKMPKDKEYKYVAFLRVEYEGKIIDTIDVLRTGIGGLREYFVNGRKDTLFIDMNGEKRSYREYHTKWYNSF